LSAYSIPPAHESVPVLPGEALTRRAVTTITGVIAALAFVFSFGNVAALAAYLHVPVYIGWLVGPAVDLSVIGLLIGIRYLSLHGYSDQQLTKPRRLLAVCGLLTMALNTAESICTGHYGTAAFDAVAPALLLGWSENGPWLLRQIYTVRTQHAAAPQEQHTEVSSTAEQAVPPSAAPHLEPSAALPAVPPTADDVPAVRSEAADDGLLVRAHELDNAHRRTNGRPISRDRLRSELHIARDRAGELCQLLRAEAAAAAEVESSGLATEHQVGLIAA
jgi:uncharacterized protein DUF2637